MKNYLIYGEEDYLINQKINEIIGKVNEKNDYELEKFDLVIDQMEEIIVCNDSMSLFSEKKIIVISNIDKIMTAVVKDEKKQELLIGILNSNNSNVIILVNSSLDERKKITKELKKITQVYKFDKLKDNDLISHITSYVKNKNINISVSDISKLINKTTNDLYIVHNELSKLELILDDTRKISSGMIDEFVCDYSELDTFGLLDAVMAKDKIKAINMLNVMVDESYEVISLVALIASQVRLLIQIKVLKEEGYSQEEMTTFLKIHPFRIKKALGIEKNFSKKKLMNMLSLLGQLDMDIKSIEIDPKVRLELFILGV